MGLKVLIYKVVSHKFLKAFYLVAFFFAISFFYYQDIFSNWFIIDDVDAIWCSLESLRKIFLESNFSLYFYTPLIISHRIDFLVFKLNPVPYHVHNFIILVFIAFVFYKILRLYTSTINSLVPALFILFSTPSLVMVSWIVLRQYLYPALFSLTAIYIFIKYRPTIKEKKLLILFILVLSELSFTGKEQFMTLPFILFILSNGNIRKRITDTIPYFILLIIHFILRTFVLKGFGGYLAMTFDPKIYFITVIKSFFTASQIVFGYKFFILFIVAPLVLFSSRKVLLISLIWLSSLGIQFLTMADYPDALSLRYWFIPVVLLSFMVSCGAESIKNNPVRVVYIVLIVSFFALNTFHKSKEVKSVLKEEPLLLKLVSEAMIDKKYIDSLIIIPQDMLIERGGYIRAMNRILSEKLQTKTYSTFIYSDFLMFFPDFNLKNYKHLYEIKAGKIIDITSIINEKMDNYKKSFEDIKPAIELSTDLDRKTLTVRCNTLSKGIMVYTIIKFTEKLFYYKSWLPHAGKIKLDVLLKEKRAYVLPLKEVFFDGKQLWPTKERELKNSESIRIFSFVTPDNKITYPADNIFYLRGKQD